MVLCVCFRLSSSAALQRNARGGLLLAVQSQLHSSVTGASQLFPSFSQASQPACTGAQMNDYCLLCLIIFQEMCFSPPFNMFFFVFLIRQTKWCHEGREKAARLECKAWWEAWWWQAWGIWYGCPLEGFLAAADKMKEKYFTTFSPSGWKKVEKACKRK